MFDARERKCRKISLAKRSRIVQLNICATFDVFSPCSSGKKPGPSNWSFRFVSGPAAVALSSIRVAANTRSAHGRRRSPGPDSRSPRARPRATRLCDRSAQVHRGSSLPALALHRLRLPQAFYPSHARGSRCSLPQVPQPHFPRRALRRSRFVVRRASPIPLAAPLASSRGTLRSRSGMQKAALAPSSACPPARGDSRKKVLPPP